MSGALIDWAKVLHILSFTAWMAGNFYLPRLFVYHTRLASGSEPYEMFCVMERKLLVLIMRPAAIATWIFGVALAWRYIEVGYFPAWLLLKIACVIGMTTFHWSCSVHARQFAVRGPVKSERYYRFFNEAPTVLLLAIVYLVIFQPTLFGY